MRSVVSRGFRGRSNSFTLVELLTVIFIIVILAGLTLAAGEGVMNQAARSRTRAEIQAMSAALESYKADNGIYPSNTFTGGTNGSYSATSLDGTSSTYQQSSQILYQALAGKTNFTDPPVAGVKYYMSPKADALGNAIAPTTGPTYFQDPFGYSYGYNAGDTTVPADNTTPYNGTGFFDLWSTGGSLTTTTPSPPTNSWISNWTQ
jgi:Tfp pilus assembly protein PilE